MGLKARMVEMVRRVLRSTGFDVVRYNALPLDVDPEIQASVLAVSPFTMTSLQRVSALCEAVQYLSDCGIKGDIVECGVWRGGSMMAVARTLIAKRDLGRRLYLFDTFSGMSMPTDKDVQFTGESAERLLSSTKRAQSDSVWCIASIEEVRRNMASTGYDPKLIHFVQGKVEETLPAAAPDRIALLRLDTDWYESTRHELKHLYPRLVQGGVLILDDFGHWQGARAAVEEYIKEHRLQLLLNRIDYSGRSAIKLDGPAQNSAADAGVAN